MKPQPARAAPVEEPKIEFRLDDTQRRFARQRAQTVILPDVQARRTRRELLIGLVLVAVLALAAAPWLFRALGPSGEPAPPTIGTPSEPIGEPAKSESSPSHDLPLRGEASGAGRPQTEVRASEGGGQSAGSPTSRSKVPAASPSGGDLFQRSRR